MIMIFIFIKFLFLFEGIMRHRKPEKRNVKPVEVIINNLKQTITASLFLNINHFIDSEY